MKNVIFLRDEVEVDTKETGVTETSLGLKMANDTNDYQIGKVLSKGIHVSSNIEVGDEIIFLTNALNKVSVGDVNKNIVFEKHVYAKIK